MTLLTAMHQRESSLNIYANENTKLTNKFDCSIHNCLCQRMKIGLILYPKDIEMKNIILLVCEQCYNYKYENGSAHDELEKWYFNIYQDSISFDFKSKFIQNQDKSYQFNYNLVLNKKDLFDLNERILDNYENDMVQQTIEKKTRR